MESRETLNVLYLKKIIIAVQKELAQFFIKKWNFHYKDTHGEWKNNDISGKQLCILEAKKRLDKDTQEKYENGDTSKWDCKILFTAILYSNSIGKHLDKHTKDAIHGLRGQRNKDAHWYESKYPDIDFDETVSIVEKSFRELEFSLDEISEIKNNRNSFNSFKSLPSKPDHFIVERSQLRDEIIKDLKQLRIDSKNELTYFYISGKPGSGKTQLARQVFEKISCDWKDEISFVMTLDGSDVDSLLKTYCELGNLSHCSKSDVKRCLEESATTIEKVENLRSLLSTRLKFWQNWWIIVDNVVHPKKICPLLPQIKKPEWLNGQIIFIFQNTGDVPQYDGFTKHISICSGMNDGECSQLLKHYTKDENADDQLLSKVSQELDRQPLALAAAGCYVSRVNRTNCSFTWMQYLEKILIGEHKKIENAFVGRWNSAYHK
ncbi:uncharacterized protein LOC124449473 [Xenia sp. Carnegie-2017]|uniref:uncharacterized protein LOC124449473 n=1 Tax=Xenia sp. Carnegie-2017 TaxID=2897299 RepID=UPI001F0414D0|nr:uncharacterized protein LOC124449473 [Xenia sp. Carnegie-2017]XP_046856346.1 uncharacterized protein LOC124449473 [Xenia sp. Carnegie-2017]